MSLQETLVILATLNEEEGIGPTLEELRGVLGDVSYLVVDGNSNDGTVEIAEKLGAKVLMQTGRGKGSAVSEAIANIDFEPKYVVLTDADFTYPAKYILDMVRVLEEQPDVGMVMGNRFNHLLTAAAMKDPFYFGNKLLAITHRIFNGVDLNDPLTGLRVVRWDILKGWKPRSKGFDLEAELNHHIERQGKQIVEVSVPYRARLGEKKLKLRHGLIILTRMLKESLTDRLLDH